MITNNEGLNQFIANVKAFCSDVVLTAELELANGVSTKERENLLQTKIVDYKNFMNILNMDMMYPRSCLSCHSAKVCDIGDVFYIVSKGVTWEEMQKGVKKTIVKAKCKKIAIKQKTKYYVFEGVDRYYSGVFRDSSFGKTLFISEEEAKRKL